jgi:hypothetical protein
MIPFEMRARFPSMILSLWTGSLFAVDSIYMEGSLDACGSLSSSGSARFGLIRSAHLARSCWMVLSPITGSLVVIDSIIDLGSLFEAWFYLLTGLRTHE